MVEMGDLLDSMGVGSDLSNFNNERLKFHFSQINLNRPDEVKSELSIAEIDGLDGTNTHVVP